MGMPFRCNLTEQIRGYQDAEGVRRENLRQAGCMRSRRMSMGRTTFGIQPLNVLRCHPDLKLVGGSLADSSRSRQPCGQRVLPGTSPCLSGRQLLWPCRLGDGAPILGSFHRPIPVGQAMDSFPEGGLEWRSTEGSGSQARFQSLLLQRQYRARFRVSQKGHPRDCGSGFFQAHQVIESFCRAGWLVDPRHREWIVHDPAKGAYRRWRSPNFERRWAKLLHWSLMVVPGGTSPPPP